MPVKREADPFIKPDPDAKRVKREGGDGNFSLSSIPMAPSPAAFASPTSSALTPKIEGGDRKHFGPARNFGGAPVNKGKRKFFGNSIVARRDEDWVSAHFMSSIMVVEFTVHFSTPKPWSSTEVEQEIFKRLNKAKFKIQPSEDWGFIDRKFGAILDHAQKTFSVRPPTANCKQNFRCTVNVHNLSATEDEKVSTYSKKEEKIFQPKNGRSH